MRVKPITEKVWSCPWLCDLYFDFVNLLKHVCHPNTNNSFSLSLISYICLQLYLDIYGRWLFEMKPKQFDLMLGVFLTLSAAILSSSLKKWRISECRQKQQPNVWDLLSPPPSSASCACNSLRRSSGGNVAVKASRLKNVTCMEKIIPGITVHGLLCYLHSALLPHTLFGIQKRWRPLGGTETR